MPISDEEFQRFQNQLLDFKAQNYELDQQVKKLTAENKQLKTQIETTEKESISLRLPTKVFPIKLLRGPSRDLDKVQRENDALTRRADNQEEEFKKQNETMKHELNEHINEIERLKKELKLYEEGRHTNSNNSSNGFETNQLISEENRRLKAENNVLQKKLSELSNKTIETISTASSSNESFHKDDIEVECDDNRDAGLVHIVSNKTNNGENKPFDSQSIRLETELEEKRLLQDQYRQLEISSNEIKIKLSQQIEQLKEKLDEKQNTCLQLQHDYEKRIQDIITETNQLKTKNELEIDVLKSDIKRLQEQIDTITKTKDEEIAKQQKRANDLQVTIDQLESQIGTVAAEQNLQLRTTNAEHQRIVDEKEFQLNEILFDRDLLRTEIEQSKEAYESLLQTVQLLEQQITNKTRDYESQQRLAEQRKNLIDEMAANHLQAEEKAKSIVQTQKEKYQNELEKFEKEIVDLKAKVRTMKQLQNRCTEFELQVKSDEEIKQNLNTRLEEFQKELVELKEHFQIQINQQQIDYEKEFDRLKLEHDEHIQNLTEILSTKAHTIDELNGQIDALRGEIHVLKQEASTFIDDKRNHEKKGAALMKDLQKQLNIERKKNERMQEKLTELLSGDKAALDELFYIPKTDGSRQGDTASVSSFGGGTGYIDRASVTSTQMSTVALEQENKDLIQKLARTQEERSILEEKVRHLESASSSMANDILQQNTNDRRSSMSNTNNTRFATPPTRRRQNLSTDRQTNLSSNFRQMLDSFSGNKTQSNYIDTIKNLQRLLEETLTKNMHLQKDLEAMSLQLQNQSSS